jgi:phasin family protein
MMTAEQIIAAHKAQLTTLHEMTSKALATVEKIADLNLQATKQAIDEHAENAHVLLNTKDVKDLVKLQQNTLQPMAEKALNYNRHLYEIAAGLGEEFSDLVDAQLSDAKKQFMIAMELAMKNMPHVNESGAAMLKHAMDEASKAMNSVQKAIKENQLIAKNNIMILAESTAKIGKSSIPSKTA